MPTYIRSAPKLVFLVTSAAVIFWSVFRQPLFAGDRWEYLYPLQAWFNHASPSLVPEDVTSCTPILRANGFENFAPEILDNAPFYVGIARAQGYTFCYHFWLYPLFCLPAKYLLSLSGANELAAFQVTNTALFAVALYVVLFHYAAPVGRRLTLAGLAGISPVIWYLRWTSPEAFTWAFVVISLVLLSNKQHVLAAICASIGAMQNPPVLFLAGYIALLSWRERHLATGVLTAGGAALSFTPSLFYYWFFGHPNLIVASGAANARLISFERTWSFLIDLNQGMLPYVPLLLGLGCIAASRLIWMRNRAGLGMVIALLLMILACESTLNWNSGATGMMRYAVWIVPIFAWLVAEYACFTRLATALAVLAITVQGSIVLMHSGTEDFLEQTLVARLVLSRIPILYNPLPEIFYDRQLHTSDMIDPAMLPLPFLYKGQVTKVLVDAGSLERLPARFDVDPIYLEEVKRKYQDHQGFFYLTPTGREIKLFPSSMIEEFRSSIKLALANIPERVCTPQLPLKVLLSNVGKTVYFSEETSGAPSLRVTYLLSETGKEGVTRGVWFLPHPLEPGETLSFSASLPLPGKEGQYEVEIKPVLEFVAFGRESSKLSVDARSDSDSGYCAHIIPLHRGTFRCLQRDRK